MKRKTAIAVFVVFFFLFVSSVMAVSTECAYGATSDYTSHRNPIGTFFKPQTGVISDDWFAANVPLTIDTTITGVTTSTQSYLPSSGTMDLYWKRSLSDLVLVSTGVDWYCYNVSSGVIHMKLTFYNWNQTITGYSDTSISFVWQNRSESQGSISSVIVDVGSSPAMSAGGCMYGFSGNVPASSTGYLAEQSDSIVIWDTTYAVAPVADFTGVPTSGTNPLTVQFYDFSTGGPTAWNWSWGDGEANGTTQNPTHIYSSAGTFNVTLTATNGAGSDAETKLAYVEVTAPTPTPTPTPEPIDETYIAWDDDDYIEGETAIISYTVSDAYWNSAYNYLWKLEKPDTSVIVSYTIATQPTDDISPISVTTDLFETSGVYVCSLYREKKSTHATTLLATDTAYINIGEYVSVVGTTYDAINSTVLSAVNVSCSQTGITQYDTSTTWGSFNFDGLYTNSFIGINGTKTGWDCTATGFTALVGGPQLVYLSLIPAGGAEAGAWIDDGDGSYTDTTYSNNNTSYWNPTYGAAVGGYVYAGPLMGTTSGATITLSNGSWSDTYLTDEGGWYIFTEIDDGCEAGLYNISVNKTGHETVTTTVLLIEDYFARKDFYLGIGTHTDDSSSDTNTSYWNTTDGTAAGGLVFLGPLWSPAEGATVAIANGTWSDSFTTLAGGWWQFDEADGLGDNETYTMTVSKTGYDSVTANITCLADNFTRKDFYLGEIYALTVHIKDSKTDAYITTNNVTAILGGATSTTVTTTDGTAEFTGLSYGTYSLSVSADGYYAVSTSVTVESATDTETVYLLAKEDIGDSGPSSNYPPHMVRITYMDTFGNPVDGATVTATAVESSTPWDWMAGAFGFDEDYVDIRNETLIGTTDSGGTITFLMVESVRYSVNCVQSADGVDHTFSVFPKESEYFIRIGTLPVVTSYPAYNLTAYDLNATHVRLSMNYTDTANQTSSALFIVENITGSEVYNASVTLTNGTGTAYYDVNNTKGASYSFRLEANNSQHGTITSMMGIDLKGSGRLVEFGWPALWYYLLSFGCLFMLAGAFGEMDVKIGGILVPLIGAGIFWYIGWLPVNLGSIIFVAVFVGVFYYMRAKLPAVTDG